MCGDYSFPAMSYFWKKVTEDLDHPHVITLLEGMKDNKTEDIDIMYSRGCDWTETIETDFKKGGDIRAWEYDILHRKVDAGEKADKDEALRMAEQCDVIIAAVGENVMLCGENRDRHGLRLPGHQEQFVKELINTGKPVVLVVFGGRAQVISGLAERCAAVIQAWYPGEEGGHAVADILYGKVSPSAKLSVSYPKHEIRKSICYNTQSSNLKSQIQWPFGYGLSYTSFEYKNLKVDSVASTSNKCITLSFNVTNTGQMEADEIAQIYLSPQDQNSNLKPLTLQGFVRIPLRAGQTKTVKAKLYVEQFGYYTHEGDRFWNVSPGDYTIKVGASSADIRLEHKVSLTGETYKKPLREYYFSEVFVN